jgi:hypothetical protein
MFGGLEVVDRNLIPVGVVGLFRSLRMRWEQYNDLNCIVIILENTKFQLH